MSKYQEALDSIKKDLNASYMLGLFKTEIKLLQELVDRDKENFNYILRTRDSRFHTRIAFHTEREALEFVHKYEVKGCSLNGVKFYKESDYQDVKSNMEVKQ